MDKRFLESSEFYSKRYNNFSIIVLLPVVAILTCLVVFSFFGKREITIDGQGNLDTAQNVPIIQGTTGSVLKKNYLKEGRFVKKGQMLLVYKNTRNQNQKVLLENQVDNLNRQISSLQTLKTGLLTNQNTFLEADQFGYKDLLKGYLDQRQIYLIENKLLTDKSNLNINKQQQSDQLLYNSINQSQDSLTAYQVIYDAINTNKSYPQNSKFYYIYQGYQSKLKSTSNQNEKEILKSETLASIQQQIDTLKNTIDSNKEQKIALQGSNDLNANLSTNNEKMATLQADQTQSATQQLSKAKQSLLEIQTNLKQLNSDSSEYTVKAPKTGVLHLNDEFKGVQYAGTGTTLAQVYPILKNQDKIQIKAYIPSQDISSIKKGQILRLQLIRNLPKAIIIQGKVNNISVAPINSKNRNYYIVTAEASLSASNKSLIHYGMSGKVSIITGKTTFFNYYKNKLFNRDLNI